jgi:microcystin-dependent protein
MFDTDFFSKFVRALERRIELLERNRGGNKGGGGTTSALVSLVPVGVVIANFGASKVPAGFLACDGGTYNRADYPDLYNAIDPTFRIDASTFRTPNVNEGRTLVGSSTSDNDFKFGNEGGAKTVTLTREQAGITMGTNVFTQPQALSAPGLSNVVASNGDYNAFTGHIASAGNTIQGFGSQSANTTNKRANWIGGSSLNSHNNMSPYVATQFIIKAYQIRGEIKNTDALTLQGHSANFFIKKIADLEKQLEGTDWTNLPLINGATAWGGDIRVPQYKRVGKTVTLRGFARTGTSPLFALLPEGFRPGQNGRELFSVSGAGQNTTTSQRLDVQVDGNLQAAGMPNNSGISLSGVSFDVY